MIQRLNLSGITVKWSWISEGHDLLGVGYVVTVGKILSPRYRASPGVATETPAGARSPKEPPVSTVMTVHHQQNHHVAALSGVAVANNGLNLSRMSGLEAHRLENMVDRNGVAIERLSNGLDSRNNNLNNNNNNNNNNNGLERGDASTTMPQRSRFMITDILGGASSKMHQSGLPSQEPPGSPPSTPRDLSVRHQSRTSLSTSNLDEDSDASHHDGASVTSNGKSQFITRFRNCSSLAVIM